MKINLFKSQLAWLFIIFTIGTLSSCGGGGGGSNTSANTEVINGIAVPPEPDSVTNNATIAGVDVNNNGVRDDVERKVAVIASSTNEFQQLQTIISEINNIMLGKSIDRAKLDCLLEKYPVPAEKLSENNIQQQIFNLSARYQDDVYARMNSYSAGDCNE